MGTVQRQHVQFFFGCTNDIHSPLHGHFLLNHNSEDCQLQFKVAVSMPDGSCFTEFPGSGPDRRASVRRPGEDPVRSSTHTGNSQSPPRKPSVGRCLSSRVCRNTQSVERPDDVPGPSSACEPQGVNQYSPPSGPDRAPAKGRLHRWALEAGRWWPPGP